MNIYATYTDEFVFHPFQNQYDRADDRWLVGARLSLNDISVGDKGSLRISAWGKNLTDEEYREWGIDFASLGYAGSVFGQPRTYGVDLVYRFGDWHRKLKKTGQCPVFFASNP